MHPEIKTLMYNENQYINFFMFDKHISEVMYEAENNHIINFFLFSWDEIMVFLVFLLKMCYCMVKNLI